MEVQIPIGPIQHSLPPQAGHGKALVAQGQHPVPAGGQIQHQPVPDGNAAGRLRGSQIVDHQAAGKGPAVGVQAYHHHAAAVLRHNRIAEIAVVGVEVEDQIARAVVDGDRRLVTALLLRHRQIVAAVEPRAVVAQPPLRLHRAACAVLIQNVERIPPHGAHGGLAGPHGQLGAGHIQHLFIDNRAVLPNQLGGVEVGHQQAGPQPPVPVVGVCGVGIDISGSAALTVHEPAPQGREVASVLHGGQNHHRQHHGQHQQEGGKPPEKPLFLLRPRRLSIVFFLATH